MEVDPELLINKNLSILQGAIRPFGGMRYDGWYMNLMRAVADSYKFDFPASIILLFTWKIEPQPIKRM
jgi:excinuclease UvrABC ATPase subunit